MILIFIKQKKISLDKVWSICAYNTGQKFGPLLFLMFLKEIYYAHQACIYLIKINK